MLASQGEVHLSVKNLGYIGLFIISVLSCTNADYEPGLCYCGDITKVEVNEFASKDRFDNEAIVFDLHTTNHCTGNVRVFEFIQHQQGTLVDPPNLGEVRCSTSFDSINRATLYHSW